MIINSSRFYKAPQELEGIFPSPFIQSVQNGSFNRNITQNVIVNGLNFTPSTRVELSDESLTVNSVTYVSPNELTVNISSGNELGSFDILVRNNQLNSGTQGQGKINVKDAIWIDLRTTPIANLGLEMSTGVIVNQDTARGLWASGTGNIWNRGVKFTANKWNRVDNIEFSFVFTRSGNGLCMFGIGGDNINVNALGNQSFYRAETQLFYANSQTNAFYGGGLEANWFQIIGTTVVFDVGKFYKVKFSNSGANGATMNITEVSPTDFDNEINTLHEWISNSPASDPILMPFWAAPNTPNVFLTAFKIF